MKKPTVLQGRVRVVPVADVDTDMIFHNKYLHITNPSEMGRYIFGNLKGWENYTIQAKNGDILIVGHNFGCGSSRQQAVDGFLALGVAAIGFLRRARHFAARFGMRVLHVPNRLASTS